MTSHHGSDTGCRDPRQRCRFRSLAPRVREIEIRMRCEVPATRPGVTPSMRPTTLRQRMPRPRSRTERTGSIWVSEIGMALIESLKILEQPNSRRRKQNKSSSFWRRLCNQTRSAREAKRAVCTGAASNVACCSCWADQSTWSKAGAAPGRMAVACAIQARG